VSDFAYVGSELDLFAVVHNWKAYWVSEIRPFLRGDVLEIGAGIGSNTQLLSAGAVGRWVCLEPDRNLLAGLESRLADFRGGPLYESICGTLNSLQGQLFDTLVYVDVLEHIENDREQLRAAASHLRPGGRIIVLSPAHQWLYTPFDAAIGHFRRYNRPMLQAISPSGMRLERMRYLDSIGLFASSANRLFLQQSMPTSAQLHFWDSFIIPISRVVDKLICYSAGKTIIAIWQKPS
jgi:SAM-dependent methyltransferase